MPDFSQPQYNQGTAQWAGPLQYLNQQFPASSPVTLQSPGSVGKSPWMAAASLQPLRQFGAQIPGMFDTSGLKSAADQFQSDNMGRMESNADAAARATTNRAIQNGGRVGSDFAKGGMMLGAMRAGNAMQYDYAKLAAQMRSAQAGLMQQNAQGIVSGGLQRASLGNQFTEGQQSLGLRAAMGNQEDATRRAALNQGLFAQYNASQSRGNGGNIQYNQGQFNPQNTMGYIPNAGPIQGATIAGQYQPHNAYSPETFSRLGYQSA